MKKLGKFDWSRLSHKHPAAYSPEELFDYMLHFSSDGVEKYEAAQKIKVELNLRRKGFNSPDKVRKNDLRDAKGLEQRKKVIADQLKYLSSFPSRPDSRSEMLFMEFKLNTIDGIAMCSVDKIEIRGEYVWYFVTQTVMKTNRDVVAKKAQMTSDLVESNGFDFISFIFNPTKAMDKRNGWLTWNFDIIFNGTGFPEIISRTDIDQHNVKAKKAQSMINREIRPKERKRK